MQAVYFPANDLVDPAPAATLTHLNATTVSWCYTAELGIYLAVDPLDSKSKPVWFACVTERNFQIYTYHYPVIDSLECTEMGDAILGVSSCRS